MTPEQRHFAYELITNPPPGSKLAEAKAYGIDLTLLVENLELSVAERWARLYAFESFLEKLRPSVTVKHE
jgi:hypothetical protein